MKSSAIDLLEVLLEETAEESHELAQGICLDIKVKHIEAFMKELWNVRKQCKWQALYGAYHILCKVRDYQPEVTESFFKKMDELVEKPIEEDADIMLLHVQRWSRSIEVNYMRDEENPILTKVYFPYDPDVCANKLINKL